MWLAKPSSTPMLDQSIYIISNTAHSGWAYFIQLNPTSGYALHIPLPGSYFRTIQTTNNVTIDHLAEFLSIRITNQKAHYLTNNHHGLWMQQPQSRRCLIFTNNFISLLVSVTPEFIYILILSLLFLDRWYQCHNIEEDTFSLKI